MGFFKNLFSSRQQAAALPDIQFGRFSDSYKDEIKYDAWDVALQHFEAEEFVQAYRSFFTYLSEDEMGNVDLSEDKGVISFTLYQGSKMITGKADSKKFYAEAKIAKINQPHIGVYRQLLEENYQLKYSRYAIDENLNLTIVFSTFSIDGSPYKLYYALKELATTADSTDDVLVSRYDNLESINIHHIREIDDNEKLVKHNYLKSSITEVVEVLEKSDLNISKHPGGLSYLYLDLVYKLDYLLKPEGYTMDSISRIDDLYFKDKVKSVEQKNLVIKKEFQKLLNLSPEEFYTELYEVNSTFGVTSPSGQGRIIEFIKGEVDNMDWYLENDHHAFALAIPSYIIGYSLYNYSMPSPMRALFQLFYRVTDYPYFTNLGFQDKFVKADLNLHPGNIRKSIDRVISEFEEEYDKLQPNLKSIDFSSVFTFAKTYLLMITEMDFTRKDLR